ncbi:MAG: helix-turn-helix domain-containing protein [Pseudomonadota bacterium]
MTNQNLSTNQQQWFTTAEAAVYLRLSEGTLRTFRSLGKGPRYCKVGRAVRYHRDQLDSFMIGEKCDA